MAWFSIFVVIFITLLLAFLFWCCEDEESEFGDEGQERSRDRTPKQTQQPSTLRSINYNSGSSYPLHQPELSQQTQLSTSGRSNNYSSGPPYPFRPLHPEPLQQSQSCTSGNNNNYNSGPPYPLVPLHPMASDGNNSSAIGFIIPSTSESQPPSAPLQTPEQTPPPSYEVATSDPFIKQQ